jgi:hypothetical protein
MKYTLALIGLAAATDNYDAKVEIEWDSKKGSKFANE